MNCCFIRFVGLCRMSFNGLCVPATAIVLLLGSFIQIPTASVQAQESWPEFRGPLGNGQTSAKLPDAITKEHVVWKTPIHGKGWSSPVVDGDHIWMTTATPDGTKMSAICVSMESGKVLHDLLMIENEDPDFCHSMNSYASPTPAISKGRVYLHFGRYGTFCLDSKSGKKIWERTDFECNHFRGPASSPIIHEGRLIVAFDGHDKQYVVSLDVETGKTVWKRDREINYVNKDGDWKKAYGTASVVKVGDEELIVYPCASATIAYRPDDGKTVWTAHHGGMNTSSRPMLTPGGLLVISNGMGQLYGIDPNGKGDITDTNIKWKISKGAPRKPSSVIVDGLMYMAEDKGVMSCVDPETGESVWQERVGGTFAASPIVADNKIYFFDMKKNIYVIRAGREFDQISKSKLDDGFMASPAVVGNTMILRSRSHLFRIESDDSQ